MITSGFETQFSKMYASDQITGKKWFVGASTGALRSIALLSTIIKQQKDPSFNATKNILKQFCDMVYKPGDTPDVLKPLMERMYLLAAPEDCIEQVLHHPTLHLAIIVTALDESYILMSDTQLKARLAWIGAKYVFSAECLSKTVKRICFYTGPSPPEFLKDSMYPKELQYIRLTRSNVYDVLHATTCIPFIQQRCNFIDGLGKGVFMDGAITDFMLSIQVCHGQYPSLLVSDTVDGQVCQSVFDIWTPWKSTPKCYYLNCSVVCPSRDILQYFPDGTLPTVKDYFKKEYIETPQKRQDKFYKTYELSQVIFYLLYILRHFLFY